MADDKSCTERVGMWLKGPIFALYTVHFMSSWSRRMWNFCLSLFLVALADENILLLNAVYGAGSSLSILLLGGIIGWWVDRNNRLKVVWTTILINKLAVCLCTTAVCVILIYEHDLDHIWNGYLRKVSQGVVIVTAIVVDLANMAYKFISVEKDWFVVVTAGKSSSLADLNAATRSIDLITNIVAPILMGLIMSYASKVVAGIVIIFWHIVAVIVEYSLLRRIYHIVPALSHKGHHAGGGDQKNELSVEMVEKSSLSDNQDALLPRDAGAEFRQLNKPKSNQSFSQALCGRVLIPCRGLGLYCRQTVVLAGFSLAFLYFTVLSFDSITTAYIYSNGISESIVGICMAMASLSGVLGAILFSRIQRCLGLHKTGLLAFVMDLSSLSLCVLSIWAPGSPFDPRSLYGSPAMDENQLNQTTRTADTAMLPNMTTTVAVDTKGGPTISADEPHDISIIMFVVGIILSRGGLYMADLVISQLFQQNVKESERGIVNGVQNSLNMLLDLLKFSLVLVLPTLATFGFLVITSFVFISIAGSLFIAHVLCYGRLGGAGGKARGKPTTVGVDVVVTSSSPPPPPHS